MPRRARAPPKVFDSPLTERAITFGGAETATVVCPDKQRSYFIIQIFAKSAR
jgi:hypothetical protein